MQLNRSLTNTNLLEYTDIYTPERLLLAAILERAIRDLSDASLTSKERKDAILWFLYKEERVKDIDCRFYFQDVIEGLDLSQKHIQNILDFIKSLTNGEPKEEGKPGGTGDCPLAARKGLYIGKKVTAIQRRGRRVSGYNSPGATELAYREQGDKERTLAKKYA